MELRHLKYFVMVADEGSFSNAAKKLYISQPPLSRQIKQLEEEMGVELFVRNSRPLMLTKAGKYLYEHAGLMLEQAESIKTTIGRMGQIEHTIHFGFVSSFLYGVLPKVITELRKIYPQIEFHLHEISPHEQAEALKQGVIDVGFSHLEKPIEDKLINAILLRDEPLILALPASHRLAKKNQPIALDDIVDETLLLFPKDSPSSILDSILPHFTIQYLTPVKIREVRELHVALGLVAAGEGITVTPQSLENLHHPNVVYRSFEDEQITCPVVMKTRAFDNASYLQTLLSIIHNWYEQSGINYYKTML